MSFEDPQQQLDDLNTRIAGMVEQGKRAKEAIASLTGSGTAAQGHVKVSVGANGDVQSLDLDPKALALGAAKLSSEIVLALRRARSAFGQAMEETVRAEFGDGGVLDEIQRYLPPKVEPEAEEEAPQGEYDDDGNYKIERILR